MARARRTARPSTGQFPDVSLGGVSRFIRSKETGLFLPDPLADQPSGTEWFRVRARWRDVYGGDPTWDDVAARLSRFGLGQVLITLGGVSAVLNSYRPLDGQRCIIAALFPDPEQVGRAFQASWDRLRHDGMTAPLLFFTEQQVVALTKIALLVCPHVTERSNESLQPIGEALLMVADLIDREDTLGLTADSQSDVNRDAWLRFVVMNGLFNASDDLVHALPRTHELYLADVAERRVSGDAIDLRRRFEQITGLNPDLAWAMGIAFLIHWRTVEPRADRPPGSLSLEDIMSAFAITRAESLAIRALFAVDAGEARITLCQRGCGPGSLRPYDIAPLDGQPLVNLEGRLYCPSVRLLRWKVTTGLHHVFLRHTPENDEIKRSRYLTYVGHRFENYVEALLRRVSTSGGQRFADSRMLRQRIPSTSRACDGAFVDDDTVLLFEYKATLLPRPVKAKGDLEQLRSKVANIIGNASEQIDHTILAIEDGDLDDLVRPDLVTQYMPIVITLDMLPVEQFFYRTIEDAISQRDVPTHMKSNPIQVLAVSELELLEGYMADGGSLAALLLERIANDTYRDSPLQHALFAKGTDGVMRPNRWLRRRLKELQARTIALMNKRASGHRSAS